MKFDKWLEKLKGMRNGFLEGFDQNSFVCLVKWNYWVVAKG